MGFATLQTQRLIIRAFVHEDAEALVAYRNDPEVARYQGWDEYPLARARDLVTEMQALAPGIPGEWFQVAFELRENGALVGDCGFCVDHRDTSQAEIGYTLARPYQGRGLASEGVSRLIDYAFCDLGLERIVAHTDVDNLPSVRLLERLGFRQQARLAASFRQGQEWRDEYRFALSRNEWAPLHPRI
jgi:aminoglycoside 6'-N-acetyltransferase